MCVPPPPPNPAHPGCPIQIFEEIGPHLRLQDTKCSSIDMPPRKSVGPHSTPPPPTPENKLFCWHISWSGYVRCFCIYLTASLKEKKPHIAVINHKKAHNTGEKIIMVTPCMNCWGHSHVARSLLIDRAAVVCCVWWFFWQLVCIRAEYLQVITGRQKCVRV